MSPDMRAGWVMVAEDRTTISDAETTMQSKMLIDKSAPPKTSRPELEIVQLPAEAAEIPRDASSTAPSAMTSVQRQQTAGIVMEILPEASANKDTL
jgi:hypothetical protein